MAGTLTAGLLLLADSRLPSGGHGHSGGVEALVERGLIATTADLEVFLDGRLRTSGTVPAAAAAAACGLAAHPDREPEPDWASWDEAVSARTPSAALRAASRAQGAALLRTVTLAWPGPAVEALRALGGVHHPLVLGVAAAAAGGTPLDAAGLALHHMIGGACTAAVRLLGLDPLAVAAVAARAGRRAEAVARTAGDAAAAAVADADPALLPGESSPLHDVLAQLHDSSEATLFAS
ncbi:urease accessory UreF family protein [Pseudonocardia sp. TRM90224]|uniref:urease accessory UreF family protein n=1 Tax=Pseudonocardia sp. TRM90224 TaxID=2812678 RepID=UPI001E475BB8|nr:urease accessory UreF family protein [Pseudonocardia sp. TRM90224]